MKIQAFELSMKLAERDVKVHALIMGICIACCFNGFHLINLNVSKSKTALVAEHASRTKVRIVANVAINL